MDNGCDFAMTDVGYTRNVMGVISLFISATDTVFWSDKTKTVVKCDYEYETYDPEKGIAMTIAKKTIGDNKYEYYNAFLHWMKKREKQKKETPNAE